MRVLKGGRVCEVVRDNRDGGVEFVALLERRPDGRVGLRWSPYGPLERTFPGPISALRYVTLEVRREEDDVRRDHRSLR